MFETSPEAIYIHDFSTILNVNKAFLLQFGYEKKEDIIGKPSMASTFFKEDFPLVKALRSEFIAKGHIEIPPMRMLKCDGSSFLSEIHVSSILIRGKTHVQVISRDITERTKSERALIESENNFRLINETINDVFYLYNLVEKRYEYISPGCKRLLGADPKFFYEGGDYSLEFGFPKERIQREKAVIDLLEGMAFEIEFRAKINGEVRWLLEKSFPIFGENGKTIKNSGIVQDITARKQANKKIEDLKYALDEAAIVFVMDNQGVVISVNDKFCQVSQYVRDEILGKKYFDVIAGFHPDSFWNELRQTMKKGRIWTREIKNKAKDDSIYWLHTTLIPFLDENGESTQYISIGTDITNQKQLEDDLRESQKEAVRNAEIKENFLSNMSHEIRTPMNGVFGFSRLLLQTNINENQRKYAQSIYSSAESLLAVINDILDVSKMESGKFKIKTVEFDLHKKIENTLQILQVGIEQKKLGFKLDIDPNISPFIIGAPNRIAQVLINLIGNAIKFTERGSIRLSVKIKNEKSLFFEVVDTGIGIPKDKMDTIFESFTQVENYKTREYSGTGLGLRISRELVQLMGGQIGVKSVIHQGAVFYFTIPYMPCDTTSAQPINIHREPILFSKFKEELHILVVEDHPVNQELVIIYLNLINCTYDLAINGEEAVAKAAENKYDMILMDIQMPKMDGIEATKIIRLKDPKTPIIAMTAHALEKEMQKCLTVGMNDFLTKPFKVEQLRAFILKHIHGLDVNPKASAVAQKEDRIKDESMFDELLEEMGGDQELVNELLTVFKVEIVKFLEEIKIAIDTKDLKLMRSLRHQMKPSLILFRLDEQLKLVNDITSLFKEKASLDEINSQFHKLEDTIPKLLSQIDAELNK